jgi:hypothetical protein
MKQIKILTDLNRRKSSLSSGLVIFTIFVIHVNSNDIKMNTTGERKSRSVRIKAALDRHLEEMAKEENRSVNNLIETLLAKASGFKEPNEETKKAIEEARIERPLLKKYKSAKEAFDDILG